MLIFDIETNGLLYNVTTIHCLVIHDTETEQTLVYNDEGGSAEPLTRGIQRLEDASCIVGHNIINYDIPVISKLYSWFTPPAIVIDTLVLSRLYHPDMLSLDKRHNWTGMPLKLYGRHNLESYGHRLEENKGEFGQDADWSTWSQEMQDYCVQDVKVTTKLWKHFQPYLNGSK